MAQRKSPFHIPASCSHMHPSRGRLYAGAAACSHLPEKQGHPLYCSKRRVHHRRPRQRAGTRASLVPRRPASVPKTRRPYPRETVCSAPPPTPTTCPSRRYRHHVRGGPRPAQPLQPNPTLGLWRQDTPMPSRPHELVAPSWGSLHQRPREATWTDIGAGGRRDWATGTALLQRRPRDCVGPPGRALCGRARWWQPGSPRTGSNAVTVTAGTIGGGAPPRRRVDRQKPAGSACNWSPYKTSKVCIRPKRRRQQTLHEYPVALKGHDLTPAEEVVLSARALPVNPVRRKLGSSKNLNQVALLLTENHFLKPAGS